MITSVKLDLEEIPQTLCTVEEAQNVSIKQNTCLKTE